MEEEKKIIKYKFFESSDVFEKFQEENDIGIIQIYPSFNAIKFDEIDGTSGEGTVKIGTFVTYYDK
jgi:hypothetical protein